MTDRIGISGVIKFLISMLGCLIALFGLALVGGGIYLANLGGSFYFVLGGVLMTFAGALIAIRRPLGAWLYGFFLLATLVWALADVGLLFWPLVSRLLMFVAIGAVVALAYPSLVNGRGGMASKGAYLLAGLQAIAFTIAFAYMFKPQPLVAAHTSPTTTPVAPEVAQKDWRNWGNTTSGTRFAALDQITKANVADLRVAWTFRTGDVPISNGAGAEDQVTPLQVGNTVYLCTAHNLVFALDADTGIQRWSYDPKASVPNWQRCRGLGYYEDTPLAQGSTVIDDVPTQLSAACLRRILTTTVDARLFALDADTGKPCADFGANGVVDLKAGMGEVKPGFYTLTAAPLIAGDLVIVGGRVADNIEVNEPSGVVRAFNVHTGKLAWFWDLGNNPPPLSLQPDNAYHRATPNVWAAMAYDAKLDLLYVSTGNTTPDAWGGERTSQDDKYNSSVVALSAKTGEERWVFQTVHHDLWDYDLPAQPTLVDVPDDQGGTLPGLIQTTKAGQIFLLNRETGRPIAEVREQPVKAPPQDVTGERHSPTQPLSVGMPSIGTEKLSESSMWGITPYDQLLCRIQFKKMRYDGMFTAPGTDVSLQWPGSLGGMNWGSNSIDPTTGYLFVNDMRLGLWTQLIPRNQMKNHKAGGIEMGISSQTGTPYGSLRDRFLSPLGIPCQAPPYGTMTAIDLKTRKVAWQVPVGTVQDTGPLGVKMHLPIPIGMPTLGGSLATQSGLLFFAGTQDYYLRAYDSGTGGELWRARLPVGSQGTPITYVSPKTGTQYVVLSAGGARQSPDRGDYIIAYALPKNP